LNIERRSKNISKRQEQSRNNYINDLSRFFRHYAITITKKYPLTPYYNFIKKRSNHLTEKPGKMISCRHSSSSNFLH